MDASDAKSPDRAVPPREQQSFVRHELRAPLAVIYPVLAMLLDGSAGEVSPTQREYLEILDRNAARLEGLITSAADSGWLDCAAAAAEPQVVALPALVEGVLRARRERWSAGAPIATVFTPDAPPARVDPEDARRILANLLDNAVAYTPPSGTVAVRVSPGHSRGRVRVTVVDTGVGIPAEELGHVFEFGFRGAAAREGGVPGLGIGLWAARELAQRNGGTVALASRPGGGATAAVELPA